MPSTPARKMLASSRATETDRLPAKPAVEIENVSMSFPGRKNTVDALSNVNMTIRRNEFVSIIGRSGCGKSTLLRIISHLIQPTSGNVKVHGLSPSDYQLTKKFGFVFQDASLFAWKTVLENVELPLEILGMGTKSERHERAMELLRLVQLEGFRDHYPAQLSGGMRQRVSIARALSYEPDILLMDEPFGALDDFTRREMHDELIRIWKARRFTAIFVTHSLPEAMYLSDRIAVMAPRPGRVKAMVAVTDPRDPDARKKPDYLRQIEDLEALLHEH